MEGAYIGLLIGGMIVLSGLLSLWRPDLLSPFSGMSKTELNKVDLKHAGKSACAVLIATGIVSAAVNWFLCAVGYADAGITVMVLTIVLGGIILMAVMRKYDSNPSAWRYRFGIIFMALFFLVVGTLLLVWSRPNGIEVKDGKVVISGNYGMEVPLDEIRMVEMLDSFPEIEARTNGIGMVHVQKGNFRLDRVGACRLYVNMKYSPFVHIVTSDTGHIFFNTDDPALTEELYDMISSSVNQ